MRAAPLALQSKKRFMGNTLEQFVHEVCGEDHFRIEADLGGGFVRLNSAEAQRRQAIHDIQTSEDIVIELLRNARDAHAQEIFVALSREEQLRRIIVLDNGEGVPFAMHEHIFEPRVTSKLDSMRFDTWGVHGRGMALYSIAHNALSAAVVASDRHKGCSVSVETDLQCIAEKTDQSTFPSFERGDSDTVIVRGPHNIMRTACEFALASRKECSVYLGSITDIVATLYAFGRGSLGAYRRVFSSSPDEVAVCARLALAHDPTSLCDLAKGIGLIVSERSARRIMDGSIAPVVSLTKRMLENSLICPAPQLPNKVLCDTTTKGDPQISLDFRGLKIAPYDLQEFSQGIGRVFSKLAADYYLERSVEPQIRIDKNGIHILIPTQKLR